MSDRVRAFSLFLLLVASFPHATALAQSPDPGNVSQGTPAGISGRVLDSSGGAIPGATVIVRSPEGGVDRTATTSADGTFDIAGLRAGPYRLRVAADGFTGDVVEVAAPAADVRITLGVAGGTENVMVRGDFDRATSTGKLSLPVRDAVQTVEIIPRETIEDRGVTTINEAIETAVGVQPIVGYGGMDAAGVTSRGFTNEWVLRNGFRLFRHGVPVETINLDRLEVLKGPASLLAGQTDPGGTLNLVSKTPVRKPFFDFSTTVGSHAFYRNTIDLGGAVPGSGERLLTRFTMAHESAESHRDTIDQDKLFLAPQVRWQITPRTWAQVEFNYSQTEFDFERGLPMSELAFDVPGSRVVKDPRLPRSSTRDWAIFQSLTHALGENWSVRQALGAMFSTNSMYETFPNAPDDAGNLTVNLDRNDGENESVTLQTELQGSWRLGAAAQRTVVGVEYSRYLYGYDFFDADGTYSAVGPVNLFEPRYTYPLPPLETPVFGAEYGSRAFSLYVDHQAALSSRAKLLLGGRLDRARGFNFDRIAGAYAYPDHTDVRFSPRVGIVFTPVPATDFFVSYATSFRPNVFGTDTDGGAFDPETGAQIEVGFRHEYIPQRFRAQAAVFHITKKNVVVYQPPSFTAGETGQRESSGVELEAIGSPIDGWKVTAGYAYIDATIAEDTDPSKVGARLFGVPKHQLHLWNTYEIGHGAMRGLELGYGVFYMAERPANEPVTVYLPAHTRHDLMIRYGRSRISGRVNIENLTDTRLYDTLGFLIYPRDGIAVRGALTVSF